MFKKNNRETKIEYNRDENRMIVKSLNDLRNKFLKERKIIFSA